MVLKQPCSMKSALGENPKNFHGQIRKSLPNTRLGVASVLRDAFTAAQNYSAQRDEAAASGKAYDRDLASEALAQVLSGELPWCQHCCCLGSCLGASTATAWTISRPRFALVRSSATG